MTLSLPTVAAPIERRPSINLYRLETGVGQFLAEMWRSIHAGVLIKSGVL